MDVIRYSPSQKKEWNDFLLMAKNSSFLHCRDYMDYHADRFNDFSLMVYHKNKLFALLPANISGKILYSHQGLSFGGLIVDNHATTADVLSAFYAINEFSKNVDIQRIVYTPVPHIYHVIPAEEDLYALYRLNATLVCRNSSAVIYQQTKPPFSELRTRGVKKAVKNGITIRESSNWTSFWRILEDNLEQNHHTKPVHSLIEITMLASRFPQNIKLYAAFNGEKMIAGTVLYLSSRVCHTQYISASQDGKNKGALDLLFYYLINDRFSSYPVFDFGHSNEDQGMFLNTGLIFQKEGFGGRCITFDTWQYEI